MSDFRPPAPFVEPSSRWVRVRAGETEIANSRRTKLLVWYGPGRLPTYCFPPEDVRTEFIADNGDVRAGDVLVPGGAQLLTEPAEVAGHWTFAFDTGLTWLEEATEIHVHARDTRKRVDAVPSERHVVVEVDGVVVADSHRPTAVFETDLPVRWYLPPEDVRQDLLVASETVTRCPYKGTAAYWSVRVGDEVRADLAWYYPDPIPENPRIKGLIAFFNEHVDLTVDGDVQRRPQTPWSTSTSGLRSQPQR